MKAKGKTKSKQSKKATVLGRSNWRRQVIFKLHVSVRLVNGSYGEKRESLGTPFFLIVSRTVHPLFIG